MYIGKAFCSLARLRPSKRSIHNIAFHRPAIFPHRRRLKLDGRRVLINTVRTSHLSRPEARDRRNSKRGALGETAAALNNSALHSAA